MATNADGLQQARTQAGKRFEQIVDELDRLPTQSLDDLQAGLTHWSIQAGEALIDAVERRLIEVHPRTRFWIPTLKEEHKREASVPAHLGFKRDELNAAFLDWRVRFLCDFAVKYLRTAELGSFDNRGTNLSQHRLMVGERVRSLVKVCRQLALRLGQHPAVQLLRALTAIGDTCSHGHLFRDLAERRERASNARSNLLDVAAKAATDRANQRIQEGIPSMEAMGQEMRDLDDLAAKPIPSNEPAEYTKALRDILGTGRSWCGQAREALRAGGARGLDAATTPNAAGQPRSIEIHTKVQSAESLFNGLWMGVGDPSFIIDEDAESMAELGDWFGRTRDELGAVLETCGPDAPPAPAVVPGEQLERLQSTLDALPATLARSAPHASTQALDPQAAEGGAERTRRAKRTDADKVRDEGNIAAYLTDNPDATRDQVAMNTGIAAAHVTQSIAWKAHKEQWRRARAEARPQAGIDMNDLADPESASIRSIDRGRARGERSIRGANARRH